MPYGSTSSSRESTPGSCQRRAARIGPHLLGRSLILHIRTPSREAPQLRRVQPLAAAMGPLQARFELCSPTSRR
jgi:hypothetical protein